MTLPNKLTLARLILTPFFAISFSLVAKNKFFPYSSFILLFLYALMEISDALDGHIARKKGLVTDLGKVFDPFSDCFMHLTFFLLFLHFKYMPLCAFIIILWREFLINFLRLLLSGNKVSLGANIFGKFKTVFYAFFSFCVILYVSTKRFFIITPNADKCIVNNIFSFLAYASAFFSIVSFLTYVFAIRKNGTLSSLSR